MNRVLSLLVAYVFIQTQAWALSGGPFQQQTAGTSIIGTYAGVLIPQAGGNSGGGGNGGGGNGGGGGGGNGNGAGNGGNGSNADFASIGLFSLGQPAIGLATGAVLLFINGTGFTGTITGLIDPGNSQLKAVIDTVSVFAIFDPRFPTATNLRGFAQGNMEAEITPVVGFTGSNGLSTVAGLNSARIQGTASVAVFFQLNQDNSPDVQTTETFQVDGFKQSDTVSAATDIGFGGNNGGG